MVSQNQQRRHAKPPKEAEGDTLRTEESRVVYANAKSEQRSSVLKMHPHDAFELICSSMQICSSCSCRSRGRASRSGRLLPNRHAGRASSWIACNLQPSRESCDDVPSLRGFCVTTTREASRRRNFFEGPPTRCFVWTNQSQQVCIHRSHHAGLSASGRTCRMIAMRSYDKQARTTARKARETILRRRRENCTNQSHTFLPSESTQIA